MAISAPVRRLAPCRVRDGRVFVTEPSQPIAGTALVTSPGRVIIVGAGAAGHACAQLLVRSGFQRPVTVLSDDPDPPYDRTFCSKQYLIGMKSRDESLITDADPYGKDLKGAATLRLRCRVRALETQRKYVLLEGDERVDFDVLVLATGAEPKRSRWPESDLPNVHVLRTLEDADAIIESSKGGRQVARALFRSRDGVRTIPRGRRQSLTRARFPGSEV